jgi:hypothetical protein
MKDGGELPGQRRARCVVPLGACTLRVKLIPAAPGGSVVGPGDAAERAGPLTAPTCRAIEEWGAAVFRQFDTDKDGKLRSNGRRAPPLPPLSPSLLPSADSAIEDGLRGHIPVQRNWRARSSHCQKQDPRSCHQTQNSSPSMK